MGFRLHFGWGLVIEGDFGGSVRSQLEVLLGLSRNLIFFDLIWGSFVTRKLQWSLLIFCFFGYF